MKGLKTLIRIQKRELDELRKQIIPLEEKKQSYIQRIQDLSQELQDEIAAASELIELRGFFGDFSETIKKKQKELSARIARVEYQIQQLTVEVTKKFTELKKYEIAYDRYLERVAKEKAHKQQQELDEIGIRNHLLKEE